MSRLSAPVPRAAMQCSRMSLNIESYERGWASDSAVTWGGQEVKDRGKDCLLSSKLGASDLQNVQRHHEMLSCRMPDQVILCRWLRAQDLTSAGTPPSEGSKERPFRSSTGAQRPKKHLYERDTTGIQRHPCRIPTFFLRNQSLWGEEKIF
jgi:hypothetical protein